jgi:hypothetical protein
MSAKSTSYCMVFLVAALMVSSGCSSSSNPAGPSENAQPQTQTPPPSGNSNATGAVTVIVNPNPVPFSGKPITDIAGCAKRNNTWYYELKLEETGGSPVTFHSQIDAFDGFVVNNLSGLRINVPARGSVTLNPRWCSSTSAKHTAQHTFTGTDAKGTPITLQSQLVNLMANK